MTDDPFRWCIYCHTDCRVDEPEHADDCPSVTNVWPVRKQDLQPECSACGHLEGMLCGDCHQPFEVGDFYMHREMAGPSIDFGFGPLAEARVYEIICIGCAAHDG